MSWQNLLDEAVSTLVLEGCMDSVLDSNGVSPWMIELSSVRSDIRRACELQASNILQKKGNIQYPISGEDFSHFAFRISHFAFRISHFAFRISHVYDYFFIFAGRALTILRIAGVNRARSIMAESDVKASLAAVGITTWIRSFVVVSTEIPDALSVQVLLDQE